MIETFFENEAESEYGTEQYVKLYKINENHWELKNLNNCFEKVQTIIDRHRKLVEKDDEIGIVVPHLYYKHLHYHLYNFDSPSKTSGWKYFLPALLTEDHSFQSRTPSFVLFIHNKSQIFVIIGGHGQHAIKRYLDVTFGLDIITRIINPTQDLVHLIKIRGITGNIAGRTELYRKDQKIIDISAFGKIFKEILFEIDSKTLLETFQFDPLKIKDKRIMGYGTKGFQIKISQNFEQLNKFINNCIIILKKDKKIDLGTFIPIIDEEYIYRSINITLFKTIKERIDNPKSKLNERSFFDYDFCHPEKIEEFYQCDSYQIFEKKHRTPFLITSTKNEIFDKVLEYIRDREDIKTLKDLMSFLGGVKVKGEGGKSKPTNAPFMAHLSCDINHDNKNVFKIDNQWFEIKGNFINSLNSRCREYFDTYRAPNILSETWENPDINPEDWYNKLYLGHDNFIVLDKIISQNIELCDILYYDDKNIYLCHVKGGFNGRMRDLTNQVQISARRLFIDLNTEDKPFLRELYKKLEKHENVTYTEILDIFDFIDLFINREIIFILAFCSFNRTGKKVFNQIEEFHSNIAKYSIIETVQEMRDQKYRMKIHEINHFYDDK